MKVLRAFPVLLIGIFVLACTDKPSSADLNAPLPLPPTEPDDRQTDDAEEEFPPVGDYSAYLEQPAVIAGPQDLQSLVSVETAGLITAVDRRRATPTFFLAGRDETARQLGTGLDAETAAFTWLERYRTLYGLSEAATSSAAIHHVGRPSRGGTVVQMRQQIGGIEVYGVRMSFMLDDDNDLVAIAGNLHSAAEHTTVSTTALQPIDGIDIALADLTRDTVPLAQTATDPDRWTTRFEASDSWVRFAQPAQVKRIFYPMTKELVPAYLVELEVGYEHSTLSRAFAYVISANDGSVLERRNLTFADSYAYQVWAEPEAPYTPFDGPHSDVTPHPTGRAEDNELELEFVERNIVSIDGLNTNPEGGADPWLPAGAVSTRGNNIDAYADREAPNGFSEGDIRANISQNETFFWAVDGRAAPNANDEQVMASVTQIFYTLNWLHDYYYDSGFTESAGNAQEDNYGRGGFGGDVLLAEAQDRGGKNNANMSTPSDGLNPRMQMYLWDGRVEAIGETTFEITSPAELAGSFTARGSRFGTDEMVSAEGSLVLAFDEGGEDGVPSDGCEAFVTDVAGAIAVVDRGQCTFVEKSLNAQAAGAEGLVIINNNAEQPDQLPPLGGEDQEITIPVVGLSFASGELVKTALTEASVEVELTREGRIRHVDRDGTIDNSIVAHEWGHYYHHRNSECSGTTQCGAMSEGWGDFVALHLHIRPGDKLDGVFAKAAYSTGDSYFGIRRVPYSVDFDKNALTFKHISDGVQLPTHHALAFTGRNSEVHNAGEVWATMLLEVYVALLRDTVGDAPRLSFTEAKRRMADYMTAGLQLAPVNATYLEMRDAILAAAAASDRRDLEVMAKAFARRGAGSAAVAPPRESASLSELQESFEVAGALSIIDISVDVDNDCDGDGHVDGDESGAVVVTLMNTGPIDLEASQLTLSSEDAHVLTDDATVTVPQLRAYQVVTVRLPFALDSSLDGPEVITLRATAANDDAIEPAVASEITTRLNIDDLLEASSTDDVESERLSWHIDSPGESSARWSRDTLVVDGSLNGFYHAINPAEVSDQRLISPPLEVGDEGLVIRFDHRYRFERSEVDGEMRYWDGGVIEVSLDNAQTWTDIEEFAAVPYGGVLRSDAGNPLSDRPAFVGASAEWPEWQRVELDVGDALAGENVLLRFRVGTDYAVADHGWEIDNIDVVGITNQPFSIVVDHAGVCDSSTPGILPERSQGCACRAQSKATGAWWLVAVVFLGMRRRRRRRREARRSL